MEAKHWGLRKSRNATSLNSRFKSLDTRKVKIISRTVRGVRRTNRKKASKFFFAGRRRHTRWTGDWRSDVCSSDLPEPGDQPLEGGGQHVLVGRLGIFSVGPSERDPVAAEDGGTAGGGGGPWAGGATRRRGGHTDRKSTRLNSSHPSISYAVFCLKK